MKNIAYNKRFTFDYLALEEFEAGLVLKVHEVKSIKTGHISLKGSFVTAKGEELYLTNANIPLYKYAGKNIKYDETAPRKILMRKKEISRLLGKYRVEGLTLVPISVYTKKGMVKLKFALAKGTKQFDKREKIKKRENDRHIERIMKSKINKWKNGIISQWFHVYLHFFLGVLGFDRLYVLKLASWASHMLINICDKWISANIFNKAKRALANAFAPQFAAAIA